MTRHQDPAVFLTAQRASLAQFVTAQVYGVPLDEMRKPTRGRPVVTRARQVAIYLAELVFGLTRRQLGQQFGRDPSTIYHACDLIGGLRKDNLELDSTLRWMEILLRRAAGMAA